MESTHRSGKNTVKLLSTQTFYESEVDAAVLRLQQLFSFFASNCYGFNISMSIRKL